MTLISRRAVLQHIAVCPQLLTYFFLHTHTHTFIMMQDVPSVRVDFSTEYTELFLTVRSWQVIMKLKRGEKVLDALFPGNLRGTS